MEQFLVKIFAGAEVNHWLVIAATVVAAASALAKVAELFVSGLDAFVDQISTLWPEAAKANPFLKTVLGALNSASAVLGRVQSAPLLQGLALNPKPGAPSHPTVTESAAVGATANAATGAGK